MATQNQHNPTRDNQNQKHPKDPATQGGTQQPQKQPGQDQKGQDAQHKQGEQTGRDAKGHTPDNRDQKR
ncbi:hypothetical protein [Szabonella alba]|uniref:Uncharacterized protein n=1 Tax=Szabonella alba TaxID=2804194 RepID=A0A8K0VB97_9RHOB|nr:hypothetical protein [Szabonella alba]MBL4918907.1 hypothetical protein [Szabonella alba]